MRIPRLNAVARRDVRWREHFAYDNALAQSRRIGFECCDDAFGEHVAPRGPFAFGKQRHIRHTRRKHVLAFWRKRWIADTGHCRFEHKLIRQSASKRRPFRLGSTFRALRYHQPPAQRGSIESLRKVAAR